MPPKLTKEQKEEVENIKKTFDPTKVPEAKRDSVKAANRPLAREKIKEAAKSKNPFTKEGRNVLDRAGAKAAKRRPERAGEKKKFTEFRGSKLDSAIKEAEPEIEERVNKAFKKRERNLKEKAADVMIRRNARATAAETKKRQFEKSNSERGKRTAQNNKGG